MGKYREYAEKLTEMEDYRRKIIGFRLCDVPPDNAENYGDDVSFLCAIAAEVWEGKKPFYISTRNVLCGGAVYAGIGANNITKEEFDAGMATTIKKKGAYASREVMRRVNQQIPHHFKHYKYLVMGALEDMEEVDVAMIVTDANRIMRLCKVYTWKTGELVTGIQGTAWCANSLPLIYRTKTMTYNLGDPPSRVLMNLDESEGYCFIHHELIPLIVENFENISDGQVM